MDDYSDKEYCYSEEESVDAIEVITSESLLAAQTDDLHKVMELLSLREHHARNLLIHHRWDIDKLIAVYVEKGEAYLFDKAGVTLAKDRDLSSWSSSSIIRCGVCMEDVSSDEVPIMDCGHFFCNSCWTEYCIAKINEGQSRHIKCMEYQCNAICDEAIVGNLVKRNHPDLAEKFERNLLESYIEDNDMVKWCPSAPHCGNAIRIHDGELYEVECSCGLQFCFNCLEETHSPCSCLMWELWSRKCRDESETVNWITIHTKPCPNCHKPVEKNGGCNLVKCICGQAFCWLCAEATGKSHNWTTIAGHSCGRYKEDSIAKTELAKKNLNRYIHYHNRYKAHKDSFNLETKLEDAIKDKISSLQENSETYEDLDWVVKNGLYRLFRSRRVLSYSYPFAYYMFGDGLFKNEMTKHERELKKNLFEDQQQQFEQNVEKLSKLLEQPFDEYKEEKILDMRMQVMDLSTVTDNLCKKMYECIENDLLGALQIGSHTIAPYKSKGIERATSYS